MNTKQQHAGWILGTLALLAGSLEGHVSEDGDPDVGAQGLGPRGHGFDQAGSAGTGVQAVGGRSTRRDRKGEVRPIVDRVEGPWIHLNTFPVRPLALDPWHGRVWALNTHGDRVLGFALDDHGDLLDFGTPWSPVSIACWPEDENADLWVVCSGTRALVRIDAETGRTEGYLALPADPADLILDAEAGRGFVSCGGADVVVEVDLAEMRRVRDYKIPSKHPLFLAFDAEGDVLVAPMISGNNTSPERRPGKRRVGARVLDLSDPGVASRGLPDEDLFRLRRDTGAVEAVSKGAGTILFGHGIHPTTGEHWQLGTEAHNADPERQEESSVRGIFASNRLTLTRIPGRGEPSSSAHRIVELDDRDPDVPGKQWDAASALGQPYSLTFGQEGQAYVASLLTDRVVEFDASGRRLGSWELEEGAIPRGVVLDPEGATAFVHAWGTNALEVFEVEGEGQRIARLSLGHDPTPPLVREGRKLFYDGSFSEHGNLSCATCHVEARSDLLAWNLSDEARDDKGPLVTQFLAGIEKTPPFHWRGERSDMHAFQVAFPGLLGAERILDESPGGEFDAFEAFILSIQNPANPNQHPERRLSDAIQSPVLPEGIETSSAWRGHELYNTIPTVHEHTCNDCHALPTGTNHDHFGDDLTGRLPKRSIFVVAGFHELWRKQQGTYDPGVLDERGLPKNPPEIHARLGAGVSHAGAVPDLVAFLEMFGLRPRDVGDIASFLHQVDQGLAPAVHRGVLLRDLGPGGPRRFDSEVVRELAEYFLPQVKARNCDLVAYGIVRDGDAERRVRWAFDRDLGKFRADDSNLKPRRPQDFARKIEGESHLFLGLPVGMGERFAIDFDGDGWPNVDERRGGGDPFQFDTDRDGFPDGHEVAHGGDPLGAESLPEDREAPGVRGLRLLWRTTKVARLAWQTDEPTTWRIEYMRAGGEPEVAHPPRGRTFGPARDHVALLHDLVPSTEPSPTQHYEVTVVAIDPAGNETRAALEGGFDTDVYLEHVDEAPEVIVEDLQWGLLERREGDLIGHVKIRVDYKQGGPPAIPAPGYAWIAKVFVDGVEVKNVEPVGDFTHRIADFTLSKRPEDVVPQPFLPGPFLLTRETDAEGRGELAFRIPRFDREGVEVNVTVEALVPIENLDLYHRRLEGCGCDCETIELPVIRPGTALRRFMVPETEPEFRMLRAWP